MQHESYTVRNRYPLDRYNCGLCAGWHASFQCPNTAFTQRDPATEQITRYVRTAPKRTPGGIRLINCCFCARRHVENRCTFIAFVDWEGETHVFYLRAKPRGRVPDYKKYVVLDTRTEYTVEEMARKEEFYTSNGGAELLANTFLSRSSQERARHRRELEKREEANRLALAATTTSSTSTAAQSTAHTEPATARKSKRRRQKKARRPDGPAGAVEEVVEEASSAELGNSPSASFASTGRGVLSSPSTITALPSVASELDSLSGGPDDDSRSDDGPGEEVGERVLFGLEQARRLLQDLDFGLDEEA